MQFRTVLAPVDFSEKSVAAVEQAAGLARHFGSRLVIVHVLPPVAHELRDFSERGREAMTHVQREQCAQADKMLAGIVRQTVAPELVERVVLEGDPAARITQLATDRDVSLVVMPTHGRGRFRRLLMGSVTAKVLHDVECPVLTGVHLEDPVDFRAAPYVRVACAVGLRAGSHSERVLRWAAEFAESMSAPLELIHVSPELAMQGDEWLPQEMIAELEKSAGQELAELVRKVDCECRMHYSGTRVRDYVRDVVTETGCEALVVGRSESDAVFRIANDNAFGLIRSSPCPVISV